MTGSGIRQNSFVREFWRIPLRFRPSCSQRTSSSPTPIRVYHDLGWDRDYWGKLSKNELPQGVHNAPANEPPDQARWLADDEAKALTELRMRIGKTPYRIHGTARFTHNNMGWKWRV